MKILTTPLADLLVVELALYPDQRGHFTEWFNEEKFKKLGLPYQFVQDNFSLSNYGVIRGLHYQVPAQGKLVGVAAGKILDVAVDIRAHSPTYGKYFSLELSSENGKLLWIPPGFAHGFCVLSSTPASVFYKVTHPYYGPGDGGIAWNDSDIGINWNIKNPIISEKDQKLPSFKNYNLKPIFN